MTKQVGSTSSSPELDWSQVKEIILMLNLSVAQIDQSMNEGDSSVEALADSFIGLASNLRDIQHSISLLKNEEGDSEKMKLIIEGSSTTALDKIDTAIVAFQFYDKLTQRLDHVSQSLSALSTLMGDPEAMYAPEKWKALQESIRNKYSMEEERRMFDKVIAGMAIEDALHEYRQDMILKNENKSDEDEIEMF